MKKNHTYLSHLLLCLVGEGLLGSMNLGLNQNCWSGHLHATVFRERKWFLNDLCWKRNRLSLLSSIDHIFLFFFLVLRAFYLSWFVVTPVVCLEDDSWIGSSQPLLADRDTSDFSQGEPLSGPKDGVQRSTKAAQNPGALLLVLAFVAEWTQGKAAELLWQNSTHMLLPKTWAISIPLGFLWRQ